MLGYKPEKLKIFYRPPIQVQFEWEESEANSGDQCSTEVYPAFAADAANTKTSETGLRWASESSYDYESRQIVGGKATTFEVDNSPIENVQIVSLEHRGNGGRAYKVICRINNLNLYFDLREDVLLDTLLMVGCKEKAVLNGSYCFAIVGSQMKLVRIDSALYNRVEESGQRRTQKNIPAKQLEVGAVYRNRKGKFMLYGGMVDTQKSEEVSSFSSNYKTIDIKNMQLWVTASAWVVERNNNNIKDTFNEVFNENYYWGFDIKKSSTVVEKVGNLGLTSEEICDKIRQSTKRVVLEKDPGYGWNTQKRMEQQRERLCVHPIDSPANYQEWMRP